MGASERSRAPAVDVERTSTPKRKGAREYDWHGAGAAMERVDSSGASSPVVANPPPDGITRPTMTANRPVTVVRVRTVQREYEYEYEYEYRPSPMGSPDDFVPGRNASGPASAFTEPWAGRISGAREAARRPRRLA